MNNVNLYLIIIITIIYIKFMKKLNKYNLIVISLFPIFFILRNLFKTKIGILIKILLYYKI